MIRTVDTDVVVIAVAKFLQIGLEELWVAFGTGKNYRQPCRAPFEIPNQARLILNRLLL